MRVLHVATEQFPLLKVGGLADVLGALPLAQAAQGLSPRILLPGHAPLLRALGAMAIQCPDWNGAGRLLLGPSPSGIPIYVLDAPDYFGPSENPYLDNGTGPARFSLLAKAALHLAQAGDGCGWMPDLVHCHDWPAGLVPAYLKFLAERPVPTVMTVHNAAFQGLYPKAAVPELGLPAEALTSEGVELHGRVSLLKAGLRHAGKITTVSPTYAAELRTIENGMGLDPLFTERSADFTGILNGVDQDNWNPANDPDLIISYDQTKLENRGVNKAALQEELGLRPDMERPLFGVVSRMDQLKGLDLLLDDLGVLGSMGAQVAVLGSGDRSLEEGFSKACLAWPGRVAWVSRHDESLAHRIFGSADFLVVPSRSEPCGLTQQYALRYGAVPIVRKTGGLADTVIDDGDGTACAGQANGLVFEEATPEDLARALARARDLFRDRPETLRGLQRAGMQKDLSWSVPASQYTALYESLFPGPGGHGALAH